MTPDEILDHALADPLREKQVLTKDQKHNLKTWDFYLHEIDMAIRRQEARKEQAIVQ